MEWPINSLSLKFPDLTCFMEQTCFLRHRINSQDHHALVNFLFTCFNGTMWLSLFNLMRQVLWLLWNNNLVNGLLELMQLPSGLLSRGRVPDSGAFCSLSTWRITDNGELDSSLKSQAGEAGMGNISQRLVSWIPVTNKSLVMGHPLPLQPASKEHLAGHSDDQIFTCFLSARKQSVGL